MPVGAILIVPLRLESAKPFERVRALFTSH